MTFGRSFGTLRIMYLFTKRSRRTTFCLTKVRCQSSRRNEICLNGAQHFNTVEFPSQERKGKIFRDSENEYAHSIMENLASYRETIVKHPIQEMVRNKIISDVSITDVTNFFQNTAVETFLTLSEASRSENLDLENSLYNELIPAVIMELRSINDEKLIEVLASLCLWPQTGSTETPNFKLLWNAIDVECVNRIENWSTSKQLLVADYWFHLRLSRISKYNNAVITVLVRKRNTLLPSEVVQLLFYINLQRHVRPIIMHYIEAKMSSILTSLNINEVGIVCLGFFKTRTKILDSLVLTNMIQITLKHISNIGDIPLSAILKQIKNSSKLEHIDDISVFLTKCCPFVKNWLPVTGIHLILLGTYVDLYHPEIIDSVTERILPSIDEVRLKDITKLLFCIAKHTHAPRLGEKVFQILMSQLRSPHRQAEINCYPHCFISCLLFLAYCGIYPEDLLSKALNPSFVHMTQEKSSLNYNSEIITLYYSAEIELPNYKGEKLPIEEVQGILQEFYLSSENASTSFQRFLKNVLDELKVICGEQSFVVRRIVPYSHFPDIIMCKHRNGRFLPIPEKIQELSFEKVLKPASGSCQWYCLTLMPKSSYSANSKLLGLPLMKKRQLTKLGYTVVEIPWFKFLDLSTRTKQNFLRKRLCSQ